MSSVHRTIELTPQAVWLLSTGLMLFAGFLFSSVAFASGVRAFDTLTLLFLLGAAGTLLVLVVLYLINLKTQ